MVATTERRGMSGLWTLGKPRDLSWGAETEGQLLPAGRVHNITPKGLRLRLPVSSEKARNVGRIASQALRLRERTQHTARSPSLSED